MKSKRPTHSRRAVTPSRTGFTMAETLVVLVLLAIVGGSLMNVLTKQQQFYNGTGELIAMRTQLRQAEAILGSDLRGISSVGGDITAMTDSSIDFNYTIGTSVASAGPARYVNRLLATPGGDRHRVGLHLGGDTRRQAAHWFAGHGRGAKLRAGAKKHTMQGKHDRTRCPSA